MIHLTPNGVPYIVMERHDASGGVLGYRILGPNGVAADVMQGELDGYGHEEKMRVVHRRAAECVLSSTQFTYWPSFMDAILRTQNLTPSANYTVSDEQYPTAKHVRTELEKAQSSMLFGSSLKMRMEELFAGQIEEKAINAVLAACPSPEKLAALTIKALEKSDSRYARRIRPRKQAEKALGSARK